jgi:integrase
VTKQSAAELTSQLVRDKPDYRAARFGFDLPKYHLQVWPETFIHVEINGLYVHSLRATAATNALSHEADIANLQGSLGHANVSTTRLLRPAQGTAEGESGVSCAVLNGGDVVDLGLNVLDSSSQSSL